jgi:hypothetical protein
MDRFLATAFFAALVVLAVVFLASTFISVVGFLK